jgi:hypothetical protein
MALAQQNMAEREQLVERDPVQVAAQIRPRVVLGHHQQAVAELEAAVALRQRVARRRRVEAHVPGDRPRLVDAAPAQQSSAPREVDVRRPQLEVLVEHLAADGASLEHLAPVEHAGAVTPEDLGGMAVVADLLAVADERVLAAAVDDDPSRVDEVEAIAGVHPRGAYEPRGDGAHGALAQARARLGEEALVEDAVGVEQQHGLALGRDDPRVDRRRVGRALAQPEHAGAVRRGDGAGRVLTCVVDDDDLGSGLADGGGQRALEPVRLVDREHQDRRAR